MIGPGHHFLLSRVMYSLAGLFTWSLRRLEMLSLEHQFLASHVIYSMKHAKIGQSVHVIIVKIEDPGLKTSAKFGVLGPV